MRAAEVRGFMETTSIRMYAGVAALLILTVGAVMAAVMWHGSLPPAARQETPVVNAPTATSTPNPSPSTGPAASASAAPVPVSDGHVAGTSAVAPTTVETQARPSLPAVVAPAALSNFVVVCGMQLCLRGAPFRIHGATGYGTYDNPASEISLAQAGDVSTLELSEFDSQYHDLSDVESAATWDRVDAFIAAASQANMHVILNLSEYGQSLQAAGQTATAVDWGPYLSFIANRTNSVTGVMYKDDPTIAMVELFGEICYPGETDSTCPAGTTGTADQMSAFFARSEAEWHADAPNILVSSGGFSHLNGTTGIPWQTIVADPLNATCDIEVNSPDDVSQSVATFTSYCQQLDKPWFLAAWSSCYDSPSYPFTTVTDAAMASHASDMYNLADGQAPAAYEAIGSDFWNLDDEGMTPGTCSLYPGFSATWTVVSSRN